jgi:hypothetical protein
LPQRLSSLVQATKNPDILLYGIQTIGTGVKAESVNWPLIYYTQATMINKYVELSLPRILKSRVHWGLRDYQLRSELALAGDQQKLARAAQVELFLRQLQLQGTIIVAGKLKRLKDLSRESPESLKKKMKASDAETRWMTIQVVGLKRLPFQKELIDRLSDRDKSVRQAARLALIRLSRGNDFGPAVKASKSEQEQAISKWKNWWSLQDSNPRQQSFSLVERP